jgi:hypothetical protein
VDAYARTLLATELEDRVAALENPKATVTPPDSWRFRLGLGGSALEADDGRARSW